MAWLMHVDYRRLREPTVIYTLLGVSLVLLVGVLFSPQLNATRRWFFLAGVSIQPSELAKLALIPFLAYQIERKEERVSELSLPAAGRLLHRADGGADPARAGHGDGGAPLRHVLPDDLPRRPLLALHRGGAGRWCRRP